MNFSTPSQVAIIGTGGTIAGQAAGGDDHLDYRAGVVDVAQLVHAIPALGEQRLRMEQLVQVDSKNMGYSTWRMLALRCEALLADPAISGIVITHGTDTIEETAFFLGEVLAASKPVVLTCAMRPATALAPDGPQNLLDAVHWAAGAVSGGVVVTCAGAVHRAREVRKEHTYRADAFTSGDAGPVAYQEANRIRWIRKCPLAHVLPAQDAMKKVADVQQLPRVEWLTSHADADGFMLDALLAHASPSTPLAGLVVAGTGNGTVHSGMQAALDRARGQGVRIVRATRCAQGSVLRSPGHGSDTVWDLIPSKARIALALELAGICRQPQDK